MATRVEIVPYDNRWPAQFAILSDNLRALLGDTVFQIDHIGSTAVPGLAAKPLIDIDITIRSQSDVKTASAALIASEYHERSNRYDDQVRAFLKLDGTMAHRAYLCPPGNRTHLDRLVFRDWLVAHSDGRIAYAALKYRLANEFRYDGDGYTAAKARFIQDALRQADIWPNSTTD